jgi:hypothetical protein
MNNQSQIVRVTAIPSEPVGSLLQGLKQWLKLGARHFEFVVANRSIEPSVAIAEISLDATIEIREVDVEREIETHSDAYTFVARDCVLCLPFATGATIADAKGKVAECLLVNGEDIKLLMGGRVLKDHYLLERVVRPGRGISVYLVDTGIVTLRTARANRPGFL